MLPFLAILHKVLTAHYTDELGTCRLAVVTFYIYSHRQSYAHRCDEVKGIFSMRTHKHTKSSA